MPSILRSSGANDSGKLIMLIETLSESLHIHVQYLCKCPLDILNMHWTFSVSIGHFGHFIASRRNDDRLLMIFSANLYEVYPQSDRMWS